MCKENKTANEIVANHKDLADEFRAIVQRHEDAVNDAQCTYRKNALDGEFWTDVSSDEYPYMGSEESMVEDGGRMEFCIANKVFGIFLGRDGDVYIGDERISRETFTDASILADCERAKKLTKVLDKSDYLYLWKVCDCFVQDDFRNKKGWCQHSSIYSRWCALALISHKLKEIYDVHKEAEGKFEEVIRSRVSDLTASDVRENGYDLSRVFTSVILRGYKDPRVEFDFDTLNGKKLEGADVTLSYNCSPYSGVKATIKKTFVLYPYGKLAETTRAWAYRDSLIKGNVACENCVDCKNCFGCRNCIGCTGCINCDGCVNCADCENCKGCKDCSFRCVNCADCESCVFSRGCENCKKCRECRDCKNCDCLMRCKNCDNCTDCGGCENCEDCRDAFDCKKCVGCDKNCEKCEICSACSRCHNCISCKSCRNCVHCENCESCINDMDCTNCDHCTNCSCCAQGIGITDCDQNSVAE